MKDLVQFVASLCYKVGSCQLQHMGRAGQTKLGPGNIVSTPAWSHAWKQSFSLTFSVLWFTKLFEIQSFGVGFSIICSQKKNVNNALFILSSNTACTRFSTLSSVVRSYWYWPWVRSPWLTGGSLPGLILVFSQGMPDPVLEPTVLLSHQHCLEPDSSFWCLWNSLNTISGTHFSQIVRVHLELSTGIIAPHSTFMLIYVWSEASKQL